MKRGSFALPMNSQEGDPPWEPRSCMFWLVRSLAFPGLDNFGSDAPILGVALPKRSQEGDPPWEPLSRLFWLGRRLALPNRDSFGSDGASRSQISTISAGTPRFSGSRSQREVGRATLRGRRELACSGLYGALRSQTATISAGRPDSRGRAPNEKSGGRPSVGAVIPPILARTEPRAPKSRQFRLGRSLALFPSRNIMEIA